MGSARALRSNGLTQGSIEAQLDREITIKETTIIFIFVTCNIKCALAAKPCSRELDQKKIENPALTSKLCVVFLSPVISVSKI